MRIGLKLSFLDKFNHVTIHVHGSWPLRGAQPGSWPQGGLQRGVYLVKTSFTGGGSGILRISEGGLYISPCKTPISFIVLSQFSFFSKSNSKVTKPRSVF